MIEVIGFSVNDDSLSLHIAWDNDGKQQHDFDVEKEQLLEILLQAEYIVDYHTHNRADVAVLIDGRKYWVELERFLADNLSDEFCINVLQTQFNLV